MFYFTGKTLFETVLMCLGVMLCAEVVKYVRPKEDLKVWAMDAPVVRYVGLPDGRWVKEVGTFYWGMWK